MTELVHEVVRETCPYHLECILHRDIVTSCIPSFAYSASVGTSSWSLTLQIRDIYSVAWYWIRYTVFSFLLLFLFSGTAVESICFPSVSVLITQVVLSFN